MDAIKEMIRSRAGMLSDFLKLVKDVLRDPVKSAAIDLIEQKLSSAGIIFLDVFMDTSRPELEGYLTAPPASSIAWLATLERLGSFRLNQGEAPSQRLASEAGMPCDSKQLTTGERRKGGKRDNKLRSPRRGVTPLGEWLRGEHRLGEVKDFFSDIGLYAKSISLDQKNYFNNKPLARESALSAMTDMVVKVGCCTSLASLIDLSDCSSCAHSGDHTSMGVREHRHRICRRGGERT